MGLENQDLDGTKKMKWQTKKEAIKKRFLFSFSIHNISFAFNRSGILIYKLIERANAKLNKSKQK